MYKYYILYNNKLLSRNICSSVRWLVIYYDWRSYFRLMKYSMTITTRVMVYLTIATVSISFLNLLNHCFALLNHCFSTIYFSSYMPIQLKSQIWWWRLCVQAFIWSLISSTSKRNINPHQIGHILQWIYILDLLYLQRGMQWEGLNQFSIISAVLQMMTWLLFYHLQIWWWDWHYSPQQYLL